MRALELAAAPPERAHARLSAAPLLAAQVTHTRAARRRRDLAPSVRGAAIGDGS